MEKEIYKKLLEAVDNLPKEAIEKADKAVTRKGYDTTGYQYQYLVNVMNEVLGIDGWSFTYSVVKEAQGMWGSTPRSFHEVTVNVKIIIGSAMRECAGGHKADSYSDALKGAITNGFKKTVALFGVGKKAYEGTLDEDYRAGEENTSYKPLPRTTASEYIEPKKTDPTTSAQGKYFCKLCGSTARISKTTGKPYCPNQYNPDGSKAKEKHTVIEKVEETPEEIFDDGSSDSVPF